MMSSGLAVVAEDVVDLSRPLIVHGDTPSETEQLAAKELLRYLYRGAGQVSSIKRAADVSDDSKDTLLILDVARGIALTNSLSTPALDLREEGYRLKAVTLDGKSAVVITADTPVGALHGTYALLERMGFGFYLGGDTFPPTGDPLTVPSSLDVTEIPSLSIRGSVPWGNLSNAYWDRDDLKFIIAQLSKQRFNLVAFHQYTHEPFCAYPWKGKLVDGEPFKSSLEKHLGSARGSSTKDFGFGSGAYFDRDPFTSSTRLLAKDREDGIRRAQKMLAEGMDYAQLRGMKVGLGFELVGDPTDAEIVARLHAKVDAMLDNFPMLDYVWFFQAEGMGVRGTKVKAGSALAKLVAEKSAPFAYLKKPEFVAEGVRISEFMRLAYDAVRKRRPEVKIVLSGWGGDHWQRFTDYYLGLDTTLPMDVIFGAQDNIDPSSGPNVSKFYAQLSTDRERWPIVWWSSDGGGGRRDMWGPQCNTKPTVSLCKDVLQKGCQGMLGVQWGTRDIEEVVGFQARFAWNTDLTYESFYDDFATRCFGAAWGRQMSDVLQRLEALGPRWTGGAGQVECMKFAWFHNKGLPSQKNLEALAQIRTEIRSVRSAMLAAKRLEGLERIDWLLTSIDWLVAYDKAAVVLYEDGPVETLLAAAEKAAKNGDKVMAKQKANLASQQLLHSGFRDAVLMYPKKMCVMDEFGTFARIHSKAYVAYEDLWMRVKAILGEDVEDDLGGSAISDDTPLFIVGRQPLGTVSATEDLVVSATVMTSATIETCQFRYRALGQKAWHDVPMQRTFRQTHTAAIDREFLQQHSDGIEWYVVAKDGGGQSATWPKGFPSVTWSATVLP